MLAQSRLRRRQRARRTTPAARSAWGRRPCCAGGLRSAAAHASAARSTRRKRLRPGLHAFCCSPVICATASCRAGAAAGSSGCQVTAVGVSVSVPAAGSAPAAPGTQARVACSASSAMARDPLRSCPAQLRRTPRSSLGARASFGESLLLKKRDSPDNAAPSERLSLAARHGGGGQHRAARAPAAGASRRSRGGGVGPAGSGVRSPLWRARRRGAARGAQARAA